MREEIINLTKQLIEIPSIKDNSQALKDVLEIAIKPLNGFSVKRFDQNDKPSVLVYNFMESKPFPILLNAHLDVVPGYESQYKLEMRGDRLCGRGTQDMKAAAAALILAFRDVASKVTYPLGLQLVTDEEVGGFNGTKHQLEHGVKADFILAGESTNLQINNQAKGVFEFSLTTTGERGHAAYLWNGSNALWKLVNVLKRIQQKFPEPSEEVWKTTANLALITTPNQTLNQVPDKANAKIDIRYIPEEAETIENQIRSIVGTEAELEIIEFAPAHTSPDDTKEIQLLKQITKQVAGLPVNCSAKHGASDVRHYTQMGSEGITFGPIGEGLHSDNEWISLSSLLDYYQIIKQWLLAKRLVR